MTEQDISRYQDILITTATEVGLKLLASIAFWVICRLINQAYPDFNAVIPVNNKNVLYVSRTHLLGASVELK